MLVQGEKHDRVVLTIVKNETSSLPTEIWLSIFSFLPPNALACCALMSHQWHIFVNDNFVWKSLFFQNYGKLSFESADAVVQARKVSWKQVYSRFPHITSFKNTIRKVILHNRLQVAKLQAPRGTYLSSTLTPFASNGEFGFFIEEKSQNTILAKNLQNLNVPVEIFMAQEEDVFSLVALEKDVLLACTHKGDVICWNMRTYTARRLNQKIIWNRCPSLFIIKNGWIIRFNHEQRKLEAISINNLDQVYVCQEQDSLQDHLFRESCRHSLSPASCIVDTKLYMSIFEGEHSAIYIWDFKNGKKIERIETLGTTEGFMHVMQDRIYFLNSREIHLADVKNKSSSKLMSLDAGYNNEPYGMSFFGEYFLIIVFLDWIKAREDQVNPFNFSVIDIRTCQFIKKNEQLKSRSKEDPFHDLEHVCLESIFS